MDWIYGLFLAKFTIFTLLGPILFAIGILISIWLKKSNIKYTEYNSFDFVLKVLLGGMKYSIVGFSVWFALNIMILIIRGLAYRIYGIMKSINEIIPATFMID